MTDSTPRRRRRGRPKGSRDAAPRRPAGAARATRGARDGLSVESIVAVESPREFRIHPRDRSVAYTLDAAGARQLFLLPLRGGYPIQLTASDKGVSDPQWSPDGRRLAYVRDDTIWIIEVDGSRQMRVAGDGPGTSAPRWSPDGQRVAFLSRRRGWAQVWVVDAPVPRRGRPASHPKPPEPRAVTRTGVDIETFEWSTDGRRVAIMAYLSERPETFQIALVDVESGAEQIVAGQRDWETSARFTTDGGLLFVSDADGWFQVVHRSADGKTTTVLTRGQRDHGEPGATYGFTPLPSPDGRQFTYPEFHDGYVDLRVGAIGAKPPRRGRGRPPKSPKRLDAAGEGQRIDPWDGVWHAVGWLSDGAWVAALGENETRPQDLWLLPVPGRAPDGSRPRQLTDSLPAVVGAALGTGRPSTGERFTFKARDGLRVEGTLWRPARATGRRGGDRVPAVLYPHGGPTAQALRSWSPFKQLLVREGFAFMDVDFRGSTGYGRKFRHANHGEWGHSDARDMIDAARWAAEQPWCDGRLAIYGGSYGGYLVLCALVEEPSIWRAGIDLYGDSEIAESYRHGDRVGRIDLHRMMGSPDDPARAELYRRGSPVYRAERIEAPLLILHGRKDKRVVPLMTERMVEALEIEGKHHEVHWYDEEAHGWERRETRRDAYGRILGFLKRHVLDEPPPS
ncbi:MAG TPA: prolyl oligopeptidase family serine peptidase [Candidatus Limnocylindrales bacterium]|jgi:dipeptidyl aminopeptidase/acylaminoacyl peptidase